MPFSKFLYRFAKNAKNWMHSKKQKTFFEIYILDQIISPTKFLVGHNFSHLPKI